jgi:hypothetical protein
MEQDRDDPVATTVNNFLVLDQTAPNKVDHFDQSARQFDIRRAKAD